MQERTSLSTYQRHYLVKPEYSTRYDASFVNRIPARASAYPDNVVKVRSKYQHSFSLSKSLQAQDVTQISTIPPSDCVQHDKTPSYQATCSAKALALAIEDTLTSPVISIDDRDTRPAKTLVGQLARHSQVQPLPMLRMIDISEIVTSPPVVTYQIPTRAAERFHQLWQDHMKNDEDTARSIDLVTRQPTEVFLSGLFYPWDHVRWWLLSPGRLEYICWLIAMIGLIVLSGTVVGALIVYSIGPRFFCGL